MILLEFRIPDSELVIVINAYSFECFSPIPGTKNCMLTLVSGREVEVAHTKEQLEVILAPKHKEKDIRPQRREYTQVRSYNRPHDNRGYNKGSDNKPYNSNNK